MSPLDHCNGAQLDGLLGDASLMAGVHHLSHVLQGGTAQPSQVCARRKAVEGPPDSACLTSRTAHCPKRPHAAYPYQQVKACFHELLPSAEPGRLSLTHLVRLWCLLHDQLRGGHTNGDALGLQSIQHLQACKQAGSQQFWTSQKSEAAREPAAVALAEVQEGAGRQAANH